MYSGHPMGLFPSSKDAPRVIVTNGMMVPNYSSKDDLEKIIPPSVRYQDPSGKRFKLKSNKDYEYYKRTTERFLNLLSNKKSNILFVCTVIQEKDKRPGWANGFEKDFKLPNNQSLKSFTETIELIKSINENVKFIFINQFTEGKLNIEIETINSDCIWINFCSEGANTGVKYLNNFDDTVIKTIYKSL